MALVFVVTFSFYFQMSSSIERTSTSQHRAGKDNIGRLVTDRRVGTTSDTLNQNANMLNTAPNIMNNVSNTVDQASTKVKQASNTEDRDSNMMDLVSNVVPIDKNSNTVGQTLNTLDRASNTAAAWNPDANTQESKSGQSIDIDFATKETFVKKLNDTHISNKLLPELGDLSSETENKNTHIIEPEAKNGNRVTSMSDILDNTAEQLDNETKLTGQKLLPGIKAEMLKLIKINEQTNINNGLILIEDKLHTRLQKPNHSKPVEMVAKAILKSLNISSSNYSTEIYDGTNKLSNDAIGNITQELINKNLSSMIVSAAIQIIVHPKGKPHNYTLHKQLWIDYKSKQNALPLLQYRDKYDTTMPGDSLQRKFQANYQQRQYIPVDQLQRPTYMDKYQQRPFNNDQGQGHREDGQPSGFGYNRPYPRYVQDRRQPTYRDDRQQVRFTNDNQQQKYRDDRPLLQRENLQPIDRDARLLTRE